YVETGFHLVSRPRPCDEVAYLKRIVDSTLRKIKHVDADRAVGKNRHLPNRSRRAKWSERTIASANRARQCRRKLSRRGGSEQEWAAIFRRKAQRRAPIREAKGIRKQCRRTVQKQCHVLCPSIRADGGIDGVARERQYPFVVRKVV